MTTHLRIDFQVKEVCVDGSVASDSLRYVTFGDDVRPGDIKDFFERCGIACDVMFKGPLTARSLSFNTRPANPIAAIKCIRTFTGLGLKEAKDRVEMPYGSAVMVFEIGKDADACLDILRRDGVVEGTLSSCNFAELVAAGVPKFQR